MVGIFEDLVVFETDNDFFVEVLLDLVRVLLLEEDFEDGLVFVEGAFFVNDDFDWTHFTVKLFISIGVIVVSHGEFIFEEDFDVFCFFCSVVISLVIRVLSFFRAVFSDLYVSAVVFRLL
jgi:hypothetical protein